MSICRFKKVYFLMILLVFLHMKAFPSIDSLKQNHWTEVKWKQKDVAKGLTKKTRAWVQTATLFDEWNFAAFVWNPQIVIPFYLDGRPALDHIINKNTRLKVQKVTQSHVQVRIRRQNLWILKNLLRIDQNDWGYIVSKHKTPLRAEPSHQSKITGYLSAGLRLTPIGFQKEFVQIEWKQKQHFIPFSYVISRLNFAEKIKISKDWKDILFIMDHWVKTTDHQFISIDQVEGIQGGRPLVYNMASKAYIRNQPHAQSDMLQIVEQLTPLSIIPQKQVSIPIPQRVITTDQLFNRKVFDVASKEKLMLASANGIFRSYDGILWEKFVFFENKNFPLAISPSGKIYIGPYRSANDGKSFHQYIRWDLIFDALKVNGIRAVSELSIKDIEFLNNNSRILRMTLQMGRDWSKQLRLTKVISYDEGLSWSPVR